MAGLRGIPMSGVVQSETGEVTSRSLLERVRLHDPEAWRRFVALYGPFVYRWSVAQGLQPDDAADVTQEVFGAVAERLDRFQHRSGGDSLRAWLWTVTRNKIHDHRRARQREPLAEGGTAAHQRLQQASESPEVPDETPAAVGSEIAHRALQLMQTDFEPATWKAFWAVAVEGKSPGDAARTLNLSVAAVYKAKSRVLLRLRRELEGLLE